jgi:hypothetical protein
MYRSILRTKGHKTILPLGCDVVLAASRPYNLELALMFSQYCYSRIGNNR